MQLELMIYRYNMLDIWNQAVNDPMIVNTSYEESISYIYKGIKICNEHNNFVIYNTKVLGLTYKVISKEQCSCFLTHGFRAGVINVLRETYLNKINILNEKIKKEINDRNNLKHYQSLKQRREELINKYSNISKPI